MAASEGGSEGVWQGWMEFVSEAQSGDSFSSSISPNTCGRRRRLRVAREHQIAENRASQKLRRPRHCPRVLLLPPRRYPIRAVVRHLTDFNCIACRTLLETRRRCPMSPTQTHPRSWHPYPPWPNPALELAQSLLSLPHNSLGRTTKRSLGSTPSPPPPIKRIYLFLPPPEYEKRTSVTEICAVSPARRRLFPSSLPRVPTPQVQGLTLNSGLSRVSRMGGRGMRAAGEPCCALIRVHVRHRHPVTPSSLICVHCPVGRTAGSARPAAGRARIEVERGERGGEGS